MLVIYRPHATRSANLKSLARLLPELYSTQSHYHYYRITNNDLGSADKWFAQNGMTRNSSKYQAMVLGKNKGTELVFKCDETQVPIFNTITIEVLVVTIDDKLNFENHIAQNM